MRKINRLSDPNRKSRGLQVKESSSIKGICVTKQTHGKENTSKLDHTVKGTEHRKKIRNCPSKREQNANPTALTGGRGTEADLRREDQSQGRASSRESEQELGQDSRQ